jgi:hypothetical protein
MKKILVFAIITLIFVTMPFMSFAKTPISESEMDAVTAQEGVTLDFTDGVYISNPIPGTFSYGDSNGFGTTYTSAGWFGLRNISVLNDRITLGGLMTIDVGSNAGVTKLQIGLPSATYFSFAASATLRLDDTDKTLSGTGPSLGTLYNNAFAFFINTLGDGSDGPGSITLSSHPTTQGMEIGFNNVNFSVPPVAIIVSYGDADGFTGYTSAGYFGINGLLVENAAGDDAVPLVTLNGTMGIDVGTNASNVTAINVSLPTTQIGPINLTAPLQLGISRTLGGTQSLGGVYVGNINPTATGSLKIYSH